MVVRKYGIHVLLLAAALAASCRPPDEARFGSDTRRLLEEGHRAAAAWVTLARTRVDVDATTAIAAGYLERLRLGLGSPFRLIEHALADPRLTDTTRTRVAWALLSQTIARQSYHIDPAVLDPVGMRGAVAGPGGGRYHLDLIEGAVRQATDPRAGELVVRIAYALATAEGALSASAPDLAARVAALIRDRELARADALRVLGEAKIQGVDPLYLVVRWRAERTLDVERPATALLPPESELHALDMAPRLARVVADLGARVPPATIPDGQRGPSLGRAAALRLMEQADSLGMPPLAPIAVSAKMNRDLLIERPWVDPIEREARRLFVERATTEERLVAGLVLLRRTHPRDVGPAATALAAAVAMRSLAQEPIWYPGFGGPPVRELQERYGLASVTFGDDVDPEWRPYFRRLLDLGLQDLARVLPSLRLDGLRVVFTEQGRPESTLALHDPKARRLVLPPSTAAGTVAHEVAHDLDWQVALRRYRVRGDYGTDRATRLGGDRLASKVQDLASAYLEAGDDRNVHARRPAEVFARNVDWFVVVTLGGQGRSNGYLSSVQDEMLTGYGTVRPPDISGVAGQALISILGEVAPIYPETRSLYEKRYGAGRALTPWDLTRRVLGLGTPSRESTDADGALDAIATATRAFREVEIARDAALAAIDAWICAAPGASFNREHETARRKLVEEAARARSRGLAMRLARELGGRTAWLWMEQRLDGEPATFAGPADSTLNRVLTPLVELAERASTVRPPDPAPRIDLQAPPARCVAAPFRIVSGTPIP
jgi:hypothetical protein